MTESATTTELSLYINGRPRTFPSITSPAILTDLLASLELKADRIAIELNGDIAPRTLWPATQVHSGDKLEIVHFVGGGF